MSSETAEAVWARERDFHDALARQIDVEALTQARVPDRLEAELLSLAGDVRGRRVLDAGCGQGDLTLHLLSQGADVAALDLSPGMLEIVRRRAAKLPSALNRPEAVAAPLECSGLPSNSFDLVVGRFLLHHVDVLAGALELRRLLRPGGKAIFIENSGDNPLLAFARARLAGKFRIPRLGTEDEHPLTLRDLDGLRGIFPHVAAHYPFFEFFALFDRQVLQYKHQRVSGVMRRMDDTVYRRLPGLRRFSYRVIVELEA